MSCLDTSDKIILEVVDIVLSKLDFVNKEEFYSILKEKYKLDKTNLSENLDTFQLALKEIYGIKHLRVERSLIRVLHERALNGYYELSDEITVFLLMVKVFSTDVNTELEKSKEKLRLSHFYEKVNDAKR